MQTNSLTMSTQVTRQLTGSRPAAAWLCLALIWLMAAGSGHALRTGAPSLACLNMRPVHGLYRPKPASSSQFFVRQSSLAYEPGRNVTVEIATHSSERNFRGFMLQAYDPSSGRPIGSFLASTDSHPIESCSAATHRNNQHKKQVSLIWLPPTQLPAAAAAAGGGSSSSSSSIASWLTSALSGSAGNQKRQLPAADSAPPPPPPPAVSVAPANSTAGQQPGPSPHAARQVRFRATIVVSYQEFYTDFESSELKFDKFGYSP